MGSPELPNEEANIIRPAASSLPMHGGNNTTSDDSDTENHENGHAGYEPLAFDEETMEYTIENNADNMDEDDGDDHYDYSAFNAPSQAPETGIVVPSIDAEVESDVWNAPRPESSNIVLDPVRTEQIMSAMANINIPTACIPTWAQGISDERLKDELSTILERLRQRQNATDK